MKGAGDCVPPKPYQALYFDASPLPAKHPHVDEDKGLISKTLARCLWGMWARWLIKNWKPLKQYWGLKIPVLHCEWERYYPSSFTKNDPFTGTRLFPTLPSAKWYHWQMIADIRNWAGFPRWYHWPNIDNDVTLTPHVDGIWTGVVQEGGHMLVPPFFGLPACIFRCGDLWTGRLIKIWKFP